MAKEMIRQGGRSARIQQAVHAATQALLAGGGRAGINVPAIAERAGVTPSTIYRRWGDLAQLLADVAAERLRPVGEPDDTGSSAGDLSAFVLQYAEEMSSEVGRGMLRDVLAETGTDAAAARCCGYTNDHLRTINARAHRRGESEFEVEAAIDLLIAPICYHILFSDRKPSPDYVRSLLARFAHFCVIKHRSGTPPIRVPTY
ncbi:MAG: TetR/AcrR family transcriptional regulator [Hyphomicrobiales bacterium]|nr:TetR/AcrR family transcriptional regulator [Hyphomicrobiales bacterium]MDE2116030.1 TetR/AcrR family transcriptional regulator [Hyphomicrobiales bacterium]